MCGIAGIWLKSEKDTLKRKLRAMCDAQAHRGPDDEGYTFIEGQSHASFKGDASPTGIEMQHVDSAKDRYPIGLAHRRLSVIDTSINSHQPFSVSDFHLVFNGAIYNFKELRDELKAKGHNFTSEGDTEVVLRSYMEWGEDCVQYFNGMWAFVIFDPQKNRFFGARDITGIKPFYYVNSTSQFAFASEIKALIKCQLKPEINVHQVIDFLVKGNQESGEESMFREVFELKPAHAFVFDGELRTWKYYEPNLGSESIEQAKSEYLKELLIKSVERHTLADVQIGSCLSGGIDSSAIVGVLSKALNQKQIEAYSAIFPGSEFDESSYAKAVVDQSALTWQTVQPRLSGFQKKLEELHHIQDLPLISSSSFAQFEVMRIAKEAGVKVMLDGQGADELFGGYPQHSMSFINEELRRNPINVFKMKNNYGIRLKQLLRLNVRRRMLNKADRHRKLILKYYPELNLVNPDHLEDYFQANKNIDKDPYFTDANAYLKEEYFGNQLKNLLRYEDRNSMHHSIEARTPFADDKDLFEFVFKLKASEKLKAYPPKNLLRESMKDFLPKEVYSRTDKMGFVSPHNYWVHKSKPDLSAYFKEDSEVFRNDISIPELEILFPEKGSQENYRSFRFLSTRIWEEVFF